MESIIKSLRDKALKEKYTLQPLIIVVGSLVKVEGFYVIVDDQKYKTESCLEALDLCFKVFFTLDCQYPKPSFRIWQFIQNAGYQIKIAGETLIKTVRELLGLVEQAFRESSDLNNV